MATTDRLHDPGRLGGLIDGVSAIAITLLVIDIGVPVVDAVGGRTELVDALVGLWPSFLAYLIGFFAVGIWWLQHQPLFESLRGVDGRFVVLSLLFLLGIGFIPFTTGFLAEYLTASSEQSSVAVLVFAAWQTYTAIVFNLGWWYASERGGLLRRSIRNTERRGFYLKLWSTPLIWAIIAGIGLPLPGLAISLILVSTLMWLVWVPRLHPPTQQPDLRRRSV